MTIQIQHFSDILCVWAYVGQIRCDELCRVFGDTINLDYHFIEVFGDVEGRLIPRWQEKGGLKGYSAHVKAVVDRFEHVEIHPEIWIRNRPSSSLSCHQFLAAVKNTNGANAAATCAWELRLAFFARAEDVSARKVQLAIAEHCGLPRLGIEDEIDSGKALALVARDGRLAGEQNINVSPTLMFDGGRQTLKGNVGYKVIEANVQELIAKGEAEQSWC